LPAVVTVTAGAVEPRYANFKGIMAAKSKTIEVRSLNDLGLSALAQTWGEEVVSVTPSPSRQAGTTIVDDGQAVSALVDYLDSIKVL
jgi:electron transfer flavoprotein beta subunit